MRVLQLIGLIALSFQITAQSTEITITVKNLQDSTAIIGYHYGSQRLIYDTLGVENEKMSLSADSLLPKGLYFIYTPSFYSEFVLSEPAFSLTFEQGKTSSGLQSQGSMENKLFSEFQVRMGSLQQQQRSLSEQLNNLSGEDSVRVREELLMITEKITEYQDSIIHNYPDTFFASFIRLMKGKDVPEYFEIEDEQERQRVKYKYLKENYFEGINVVEMMRTPVIHQYVMRYFNDLVLPRPDSIIKELDLFFAKVIDNKPAYRYWLVTFFNKYQESNLMGMDAVTAYLVESHYLSDRVDWLDSKSREEMRKELRYIRPNLIGKEAPPLVLRDTLGNIVSLKEFDEEYLVIYFYDPDCGVCKKKTPVLMEKYDSLKLMNAEVLAICSITDTDRWKEYVKKNDLSWVNLADPQYQSNFRMDYNVRSTPQLYILDKERKIIAKKLDVSQVLTFIEDHKRIYSEE